MNRVKLRIMYYIWAVLNTEPNWAISSHSLAHLKIQFTSVQDFNKFSICYTTEF